ncbi:hypothetical protein KTS45_17435 [Halomicroarcula limicola]|uniref:Uncharacterized protein n=1 Tax=Haloarcula limicola TaxID=1429915 RepID=A0A8J7YCZ6_9EURY|nr:hypothetical protein [Halomicroarcula limicola]MBV0925989.1 hypothetical protein [Halomicroarcula limicola]
MSQQKGEKNAFDLHETVPFALVDSLEAIDSHRIALLVECFEDHVESLVVALVPEDTAFDDGTNRVAAV